MKSRPVYTELTLQPNARRHFFVSSTEGALAVKRVLDGAVWTGLQAEVFHCDPPEESNRYGDVLSAAPGLPLHKYASDADLFAGLAGTLATAGPATHVYLSGPEIFIWDANALVRDQGFALSQISAELLGSRKRRVTCVHCKAMNENVTHSPHTCVGCGQSLLIRDHFSRRMRAYVGVRIDAEAPGDVPAAEELFP